MGVYKREYERDGRAVWGFSFVYRKQRHRRAGYRTHADAELAEDPVRKSVILERKRTNPVAQIRFSELVELFFEHRPTERADTSVDGERNKSEILLRYFQSRLVEQIT